MVLSITGMHRSGTSLLASWISACGLTIDQGKVVPPLPGNPKGHFEDLDFVLLHENSLKRQKPFSSGWKSTSINAFHFSFNEKRMATNLVSQRFELLDNAWGWKDPRTSLYLFQWKEIIPDLKCVFIWRSCDQVVHSLIRRWQRRFSRKLFIDPVWAVGVWKAYNQQLLEFKKKYPDDVILIPLSKIIDIDLKVFEILNHQFDLNLTYVPVLTMFDSDILSENSPGYLRNLCWVLRSKITEDQLIAHSIKSK